jgi:PhoPQ-activated pathogenicity-related protein
MRALMITLMSLLASVTQAGPDSPPETALGDYVAAPDDSYHWRVRQRYSVPGADIVRLHLDSQTWRGTRWKHWLFVIRPEALEPENSQAVLAIAGGRWDERFEASQNVPLPEDSALFIEMANRLGSYMAVVGQVPYQPLFGLSEDKLIAYSFENYIESGDAEWPLLLPMVKSAVRAMDATQDFAADEWGAELDSFTVTGGSKRGWTTWLTGVVDARVTVLAPLAIDALNFAEHMPYQTRTWGAPSEKLEPYSERGLIEIFSSQDDARLRTIVDPYSYRGRLTQTKLIVIPTNDAYFPLDALNLYWSELPEPRFALYLPNEGHSIADFQRLIPALAAVHRSGGGGAGLPELVWQFQELGDGLRLCLRAEPTPTRVVAWTGESDDRDFRDAAFVAEMVPLNDDVHVFDLSSPVTGFAATFLEGVFGEGEAQYSLSTNVRILDSTGKAPDRATAIGGVARVCP